MLFLREEIMQYFDLHCDTLYKAAIEDSTLNNLEYEVSIQKGRKFSKWSQCMAIWIPDNVSPDEGFKLFHKAHQILYRDAEKYNISLSDKFSNHNFVFTVENGSLLNGNSDNISILADLGVKMLTLTWNGENCIGGGADAPQTGLTDFGKECIAKLEDSGIIIDTSHTSDKTFYDVATVAAKPLVASHSNSRSICSHRRNLTDEQFRIIKASGGLVGLNFHKDFLSDTPQKVSLKDVLIHAEHFLSLGGEETLCIGSDFDGSDISKDLNSIEKIPNLYESFLKIGYNEQLVQKILYYNAYNFFSRF